MRLTLGVITLKKTNTKDIDLKFKLTAISAALLLANPVLAEVEASIERIKVEGRLLDGEGNEQFSRHIRQQGWDPAWLPAGRYQLDVSLPGRPRREGSIHPVSQVSEEITAIFARDPGSRATALISMMPS